MRAMTAKAWKGTVGISMLAVFVWLALRFWETREIADAFRSLLALPAMIALMTAAYACSFLLKAAAWRIYAQGKEPIHKHLPPLGYSLFVNHLLPIKVGDLVRSGLAAKLERRSWDEALHTVGVMRMMDISVLLAFGACGLAVWGIPWEPDNGWRIVAVSAAALLLLIVGIGFAAKRGRAFAARHWSLLRSLLTIRAGAAWLLTACSWILEGAVPFGVLYAMQDHVAPGQAVWVNSMTVGGQVFHVTPGGIGTYETTMSASLAAIGVDASTAITAAVVSHAYKFLFAFAAGFLSWAAMPVPLQEGIRWLSRRRTEKGERAE
ncbi:lysylphosphatidylglycerol synthase transmembrane domain-containing protein [Cohnella pontilimi]|nr:lysylphosphatidylglycerol synthase transmembrane domain-containing protein [Cohnella pontilimi]